MMQKPNVGTQHQRLCRYYLRRLSSEGKRATERRVAAAAQPPRRERDPEHPEGGVPQAGGRDQAGKHGARGRAGPGVRREYDTPRGPEDTRRPSHPRGGPDPGGKGPPRRGWRGGLAARAEGGRTRAQALFYVKRQKMRSRLQCRRRAGAKEARAQRQQEPRRGRRRRAGGRKGPAGAQARRAALRGEPRASPQGVRGDRSGPLKARRCRRGACPPRPLLRWSAIPTDTRGTPPSASAPTAGPVRNRGRQPKARKHPRSGGNATRCAQGLRRGQRPHVTGPPGGPP